MFFMYSSYAALKGCSKLIEKGKIMNQPMLEKGEIKNEPEFSHNEVLQMHIKTPRHQDGGICENYSPVISVSKTNSWAKC